MNILNILGMAPSSQKPMGSGQELSAPASTAGQRPLFFPILLQLFGGGTVKNDAPAQILKAPDSAGSASSGGTSTDVFTVAKQNLIVSGESGLEFLASGNAFPGTGLPGVSSCQSPDLTAALASTDPSLPNGSFTGDRIGSSMQLSVPQSIIGLRAAKNPFPGRITDPDEDAASQSSVALSSVAGMQMMMGSNNSGLTAMVNDPESSTPQPQNGGLAVALPLQPPGGRKVNTTSGISLDAENAGEEKLIDHGTAAGIAPALPGEGLTTKPSADTNQKGSADSTTMAGQASDRGATIPANLSVTDAFTFVKGGGNGKEKAQSTATIQQKSISAPDLSSRPLKFDQPDVDEPPTNLATIRTAGSLGDSLGSAPMSANRKEVSGVPGGEKESGTSDTHMVITNLARSVSSSTPPFSAKSLKLDDVTSIFISPGKDISKETQDAGGTVKHDEERLNASSGIAGPSTGEVSPSGPKNGLRSNILDTQPPSVQDAPAPLVLSGAPDKITGVVPAMASQSNASISDAASKEFRDDPAVAMIAGKVVSPSSQNDSKNKIEKNQEGPVQAGSRDDGSGLRGSAKMEPGSGNDKTSHQEQKRDINLGLPDAPAPQPEKGIAASKTGTKPASNSNADANDRTPVQIKPNAGQAGQQRSDAVDSGTSTVSPKTAAVPPQTSAGTVAAHAANSQSDFSSVATGLLTGVHTQQAVPARSELNGGSVSSSSPNQPNVSPGTVEQSILDQVSKNLALKFAAGASEVRIAMKPESLGEVVMKVKMDDGKLSAQIDVNNVSVKAVLEANVQQLRETLLSRGIEVQRIDIVADGQTAFGSSSGQNKPKQKSQQRGSAGVDPLGQYDSLRTMGYNTLELTM